MTHAQIAKYPQLSDLDPTVREAFEGLLHEAISTVDNTAYFSLHRDAARAIGMVAPASGELAVCTCECGCDQIHDGYHSATYQPGNGREIAQCPDCADTHRITG